MKSFGRLMLAIVTAAAFGAAGPVVSAEERRDGAGETVDCLKVAEDFNAAIQTIIDDLPGFIWSGDDRRAFVHSVMPERIDARCVQTVSVQAKSVFEPMDERNKVATRFGWCIYIKDHISIFGVDIPFLFETYTLEFGILNSGSIAGVAVRSTRPIWL